MTISVAFALSAAAAALSGAFFLQPMLLRAAAHSPTIRVRRRIRIAAGRYHRPVSERAESALFASSQDFQAVDLDLTHALGIVLRGRGGAGYRKLDIDLLIALSQHL